MSRRDQDTRTRRGEAVEDAENTAATRAPGNRPCRHLGLRLPTSQHREEIRVRWLSPPVCGASRWGPQQTRTVGKAYRKEAGVLTPPNRALSWPAWHPRPSPLGASQRVRPLWSPPLREDVGLCCSRPGRVGGGGGPDGSSCPFQERPLSSLMPNHPFARLTISRRLRA